MDFVHVKKHYRPLLSIAAAIIILPVIAFLAFRSFYLKPVKMHRELMMSDTGTVEEMQNSLHTVLSWPIYGTWSTDTFQEAKYIGNAKTVRLLINAFGHKWPEDREYQNMNATYSALIGSLESLTGASPGPYYSDWKKWYDKTYAAGGEQAICSLKQ